MQPTRVLFPVLDGEVDAGVGGGFLGLGGLGHYVLQLCRIRWSQALLLVELQRRTYQA